MPSIGKISDTITHLMVLEAEAAEKLRQDPNSFADELSLQSIRSQIEDLQQQLRIEKSKREKEIVALRLVGPIAQFGSFPLQAVGGITDSFSKALTETAKYFQFGNKGGKKVDSIVTETLDLRLEAIGQGSTIFYLSAKTSPDLFGRSISESSLENAFELLNSNSAEEVLTNIESVGTKSVKHYSRFFNELTKNDVALEISWSAPTDDVKVWQGTKEKILSLYNTLNSLEISKPEEIPFEGELITISLKGRFEILTDHRERFFGTFPNELMESMKQFHIGDRIAGILAKTILSNPATGRQKLEYTLKNITV